MSVNNVSVTGLNPGEKITLTAAGQSLDVSSDGKLTLSGTSLTTQISGVPQITNEPSGKKCSVVPDNSTGTNITWNIVCDYIKYFSLSGNITGLAGSDLSIKLNQYIAIILSANGKFQFPRVIAENTLYDINIVSQPVSPNQNCAVYNKKGTIKSDVYDINVICASNAFIVSGSLSGQKSGLSLENSNGEIISLAANDSGFTFNQFVPSGGSYLISVKDQPYGQECYVLNDRAAKVKNNISNLQVDCTDLTNLNISLSFPDKVLSEKNQNMFLHLWFYLDHDQIVYPTFKKAVSFNPQNKNYSLTVPQGQYYIRAFLDVNSNELPDIGSDYQSRIFGPWVGATGANNNISIQLEDTSSDSRFSAFNAYMFSGSTWNQPGGGKCGGIYMRMEAGGFSGSKNHVSSPYVILPNYQTVELLDDGGCGDSFSNNSASYDKQSGDMQLSSGIDSAYGIDTGDYIFYYQNYISGKIQIFKDTISTTAPLSSMMYLINPSGSVAARSELPVFQWSPVAGAGSYEILLESVDHLLNNFADPYRFVNRNFYTLPFPLGDQKAYKVNIQAFDTDITSGITDFNSVSQSPDNYFITDFSGNNSATVSGKLTNSSGGTGSYMIYGDSNTEKDSWEASVFLPPDSQNYSLTVFKNSGKYGALISGINVDTSGYIYSDVNRAYAQWNMPLLINDNVLLDLTWNKPLLLNDPANNIHGIGSYPAFSWEDYSAIAPSGYSYILWLTPYISHGAPILIGIKNNIFDFSRTNMSTYLNLSSIYACVINSKTNQTYSNCATSTDNSSVDLTSQTQWEWKVMVVTCNLDDYLGSIDRDQNGINDYTDCLLKTFNGDKPVFTESVSRVLSTF